MSVLVRSLIVGAFVALGLSSTALAQGDLDCWQFATWADAQATHEANPWMNLDDDWDGIACECLYFGYPCWTPYQ
jgi:hypothetical protein